MPRPALAHTRAAADGQKREHAVPTRYWHALPDGRVQCDLCPRYCKLRDGEHGLCFVRARLGRGVALTTYGRSTGFFVGPIERQPLFHFLPGTPSLSFGTLGCNLVCSFCHHWDSDPAHRADQPTDEAAPRTIAEAAARLGCRSVAFACNDPVVFHEYAVDVAAAARAEGLKTVAVSAGYVCPKPRVEFYRHIDAALVGLHSLSRRFYRSECSGSLQPVLDTLLYLKHETRVWLEVASLVIPGQNDSDAEIERLTTWVHDELGPDVPIHFGTFRPAFRMSEAPPTPRSTLARARHLALGSGLRYAYTEDPAGSSTYCFRCGRLLIERDGRSLASWELGPGGHCPSCDEPCPGVFESSPGAFRDKRTDVRLGEPELVDA